MKKDFFILNISWSESPTRFETWYILLFKMCGIEQPLDSPNIIFEADSRIEVVNKNIF